MKHNRRKMFELLIAFINKKHLSTILEEGSYSPFKLEFSKFYIRPSFHPASIDNIYYMHTLNGEKSYYTPFTIYKYSNLYFKYEYKPIGVIKFINQCSICVGLSVEEFTAEIQSKLIELI